MTGPAGIRSGTGHWIGPAEKPSGSLHLIRGGSPASPGFFQYVCQPARILMTRPTENGLPGCTSTSSDTRTTLTFRLAPVGPPRAETATATAAATATASSPATRALDIHRVDFKGGTFPIAMRRDGTSLSPLLARARAGDPHEPLPTPEPPCRADAARLNFAHRRPIATLPFKLDRRAGLWRKRGALGRARDS